MSSHAPDDAQAIGETLRSGSDLAAEAHRLAAAARNAYGEVDPHAGHTGTLAAAHVYGLLAIAAEIRSVAECLERHWGGVR
jgi:hypothetical protein